MTEITTQRTYIRRAGTWLALPTSLSLYYIQPKLAAAGYGTAGLAAHAIVGAVVLASLALDVSDWLD